MCTSLTSVTIGNGVTSIEDNAFNGCTSLTSVTIGNGVKNIKYWAFNGCTSLTSITIPASVTNLGNSVFDKCTSFTSITFEGANTNTDINSFPGDFHDVYYFVNMHNKQGTYTTTAPMNNNSKWKKIS
jgi:hypothetical protein